MDNAVLFILVALVGLFLLALAAWLLFRSKPSCQIALVNAYRRRHRLPPVRAYHKLDGFARSHSRYLAKQCACNHDYFTARSERIMKVTGTNHVGENCIQYPSPEYNDSIAVRLIEEWMESPEHRANILNPAFSKIGIGVVIRGRYIYATQIFCA